MLQLQAQLNMIFDLSQWILEAFVFVFDELNE